MSLARFREEPWKTSHPLYQESALAMYPAPEYANSEVILSALYRAVGFGSLGEKVVPSQGRELDQEIQRSRGRQRDKPRVGAVLDADSLHMLLHSVLESPKLPNQSSKRFLQVTPLVPRVATFSGAARATGNPWPPGALVHRLISLGSTDRRSAHDLWASLFASLSTTNDDDVFARFLETELSAWAVQGSWDAVPFDGGVFLDEADRHGLRYPARQFVRDLAAVIAAKPAMTRRQWTSLLEAILRVASASHVVWLCTVHSAIWECLRLALDGGGPSTSDDVRRLIFPRPFSYLPYSDRALPLIRDRAAAYQQARLGINTLLWALKEAGIPQAGGLSSAEQVAHLCQAIREARAQMNAAGVRDILAELFDRETRTLLCRKGIGSNIMEFARHVLGQRQAAVPILRGYDQGYVLRKRGSSASSPWVVSLGPVAVLALVHCSLAGASGPRSVRRLAEHLLGYGIAIDHRDIAQNDLGHQLRLLGLVLDSPDAESGMLLVPPFATLPTEHAGTI